MHVGEAIKDLRQSLDISQKDFAKKLEISQTYLSQIESNKKAPSISLVESISYKLDIPVEVVLILSVGIEDVKRDKKELFIACEKPLKQLIKNIFL